MVRFEDGSPAIKSGVAMLNVRTKVNGRALRTQHLASQTTSYTDDQGAYRFSGLPAGEYLVRASIELNKRHPGPHLSRMAAPPSAMVSTSASILATLFVLATQSR